ncbi:MAG: tetratricopeptide repeat protein [Bdellovibrionales bacterium]
MNYVITLIALMLITGCATGPAEKMEKGGAEKSAKADLQDVKTVDTTYSTDIKASSNLKSSRARVSCNEYANVDKKNWRNLLEAGYSCIQKKNWDALSSIASKLSHNHLKAPWGPYYRSIVAEQRGDFARAIWMADLALKKAPDNAMILFQKARILWVTKQETASYEMMKKVVEADPKNYDALLFLGNIHYRDREFIEALSFYEKVLKYNYRDAKYRAAMAESNFFLGNYQESIKHYKAAAAGSKLNASLYYKLGLAYKNLKNWSNAKTYLTRAILQRRKGRSIASLSDENMRNDLKAVEAKIKEVKGENDEKAK